MAVHPAGSVALSGDSFVRTPIDVRRFPWVTRLASDYAYDFASLASFYAGDPSSHSAWVEAITRAQARPRRAMADVVAAQQAAREAPPPAVEMARRLADPRAVAIVTGQQAGLFGGPMFTLFKALTALRLADEVSSHHGVPAVPIFWIDAEDHDWDEVRTCTVLDDELAVRAVSLPADAGSGRPVASVVLDATVQAALDELERMLPATEFTPVVLAELRRAYRPGAGMADAFGRWLERVLGHRGLVVYDASDPRSKGFAAEVFAREIASSGETVRLASRAGAELAGRGYHAQVHGHEDSLAVFLLDGARHPIRIEDDHFTIDGEPCTGSSLAGRAARQPSAFSPNVLLRPIVQDAIFPTICYVAGPSELAYLGQLRRVYEHFGVPMPLVFPRASATLLDSAAVRFLAKYTVRVEALQRQDEAALNELLRSQIPPEIERSFLEADRAIEAAMARIRQALPVLDPTLDGAAQSTLGRMQHDMQTLNRKTVQAIKRRDDTLRRQFTRTQALAFPNGHPQEREVGMVSFLNQYGSALIDRLEDELPIDMGRHWVIVV